MSNLTATEKLLLKLFDVGAIRFDGSFKFKIHERFPDFPLSPNKIDLRTPENGGNLTLELVVEIAWEMKKKAAFARLNFDLVIGLPKAGEPFAEVVARFSQKPFRKMVKEVSSDGRRRISSVLGEYPPTRQRVLLIDDVVSQAQTKLEGIAAAESAGLQVVAVIVFIDREEGGSEYLESLGYGVYSVCTLSELLKLYLASGRISQQQLEDSVAYSEEAKKIFLQHLA